jgi:phosphatidylglycerol:prolipoprotein diacylglycerol transferase
LYPVLFKLWKLPVYSWGLSLAVAFIVGTLYGVFAGKKKGVHPDHVIDLALFVCIASIIAGRLLFVLLNLGSYMSDPITILYLRDGGLSFFGGLAGGILVGIWYCRRNKISVGKMADIAGPAVALGYAIVRIGCLLNGCCYGVESSVPWALECGTGMVLRHPTQIYAAIYSLIIFAILMYADRKKKFDGQVLFLYVGLYSVARFIVEFWRDVPRDYFAPLTVTQILCIILGIAAFWAMQVLASERSWGKHVSTGA